jgi:Uma2 family endonuclease
MAAPVRHVRFTYRDYLLTPEDGKRWELIEGEFYVTPAPTPKHQLALQELFVALHSFVRERDLGEVFVSPIDIVLSNHDVVQPDIIFIEKSRLGIVSETHIAAAPDLVVEIASPSTAGHDRERKRRLYLKYGVREYWIADPEACTIEVLVAGVDDFETHRVFASGTELTSPLLPGFAFQVDDLLVRRN